jgi:hypothetical protein
MLGEAVRKLVPRLPVMSMHMRAASRTGRPRSSSDAGQALRENVCMSLMQPKVGNTQSVGAVAVNLQLEL